MSETEYVFRPFARALTAEQVFLRRFGGQIFAIEGNIGAGKTTLGRNLVAHLTQHGVQATFLPERFPDALLQDFIQFAAAHPGEKNPHAFPLQMAILECRLDTYQQALNLSRTGGRAVLIDRSLPGDYVFARLNHRMGNIDDDEWQRYVERVERVDFLAPTAILYLDSSVATCKRRIHYRGRAEEDKYSSDYLAQVAATYDAVLKTLEQPVLRINWDADQREPSPADREASNAFIFRALDALLSMPTRRVTVTL